MKAGGIQKRIISPLTEIEILISTSRKLSASPLEPWLPGWLNEENAAMDARRWVLLLVEVKSNGACPKSICRKAVVTVLGCMHRVW